MLHFGLYEWTAMIEENRSFAQMVLNSATEVLETSVSGASMHYALYVSTSSNATFALVLGWVSVVSGQSMAVKRFMNLPGTWFVK